MQFPQPFPQGSPTAVSQDVTEASSIRDAHPHVESRSSWLPNACVRTVVTKNPDPQKISMFSGVVTQTHRQTDRRAEASLLVIGCGQGCQTTTPSPIVHTKAQRATLRVQGMFAAVYRVGAIHQSSSQTALKVRFAGKPF